MGLINPKPWVSKLLTTGPCYFLGLKCVVVASLDARWAKYLDNAEERPGQGKEECGQDSLTRVMAYCRYWQHLTQALCLWTWRSQQEMLLHVNEDCWVPLVLHSPLCKAGLSSGPTLTGEMRWWVLCAGFSYSWGSQCFTSLNLSPTALWCSSPNIPVGKQLFLFLHSLWREALQASPVSISLLLPPSSIVFDVCFNRNMYLPRGLFKIKFPLKNNNLK